MALHERNPPVGRNARCSPERNAILANVDQEACCCDGTTPPPPPPPPRPRFVRAVLCNPDAHTRHPEIPLYVYLSADLICPGPDNPVFRWRHLCYRAAYGPYFVRCTPDRPDPDPLTLCLPDGAIFPTEDVAVCWADCNDVRCTYPVVFAQHCSACPDSGGMSLPCGWALDEDLAAQQMSCPTVRLEFPDGSRLCSSFLSDSEHFQLEDVPPDCVQVSGEFEGCCICISSLWNDGYIDHCIHCRAGITCSRGPGYTIWNQVNGWRKLECPSVDVIQYETRWCCCGPNTTMHAEQHIFTHDFVNYDPIPLILYTRETYTIDSGPGGYTFHGLVEQSPDNATWETVLDYTFTGTVPYCGVAEVLCSFADYHRCPPEAGYVSNTINGDCMNLVWDWHTHDAESGSFRDIQAHTEISGGGDSSGCTNGCGTGSGFSTFIFGSGLGDGFGCSGCGGQGRLDNVPEED